MYLPDIREFPPDEHGNDTAPKLYWNAKPNESVLVNPLVRSTSSHRRPKQMGNYSSFLPIIYKYLSQMHNVAVSLFFFPYIYIYIL